MKKSMQSIIITAAAAVLMGAALTACAGSPDTVLPDPDSGSTAPGTTAVNPRNDAQNASAAAGISPSESGRTSDKSLTQKTYTVGIGQFASHGSLDNCREGFLLGLSQEGITEGQNLTVLYENSQTDGGIASQIVSNFAARDVDLICAIATPMAQSAYGAGRKQDIPVIYTAVTDPVAAELARADGTPVGEITGTSDKLPVAKQLQMIRAILPDAGTLGILFTTSEVNSLAAIEEYKASAPAYGFEIVAMGISSTADIPLAADSLLQKADCVTNLTDNTVVASLPVILDKASQKNIPVFGSEIEQVKMGCLAAMGLDYTDLGIQTGKMAAAVLKGEKRACEMNFQVIEEAAFYCNTKAAENLGITIPDELTASARERFTEIMQ